MGIDEEDRHFLRFPFDFLYRGVVGQRVHQVGMLYPADPDLLAVNDIAVAIAKAVVVILEVSVPAVGSITPMD